MNSIIYHLPALQVVVPLLAGPLCVVAGNKASWYIAFLSSLVAFVTAGFLLNEVFEGPTISYHLGGWAPPWGIEYKVDVLSAFILLIVSGVSTFVLLFGFTSVKLEIDFKRHAFFYAAYSLCLTGLLGITITGDAFNVFVFLEISSLSSYALISLGKDRKALTSAFQYLVMGTIGATFILIGIGLLYMMTGTLNMADLADRVKTLGTIAPVLAAFGFLTVGLAIKSALFPLHLWLPNAYTFAPSVVSAFIAATATKVSIYVLIRFTFSIFGSDFAFEQLPLLYILLIPSVLAMFSGSLSAIFQINLKRMLAYSSIAQIGYIIVAIAVATDASISAGLIHIFNHALIKAGLFCSLGCVYYRTRTVLLEDLAGLGKKMPWTFATFVIGGLSLIGVPLTSGFVSKWFLITAALESQFFWLAILIVLSSLLAIVYIWRAIEVMYFRPCPEHVEVIGEAPLLLLMPTIFLALFNIYFGIDSTLPVSVAKKATSILLGGAY